MHARAAAVRAGYSALIYIGHVDSLGEFLVAVLAMKDVLRHEQAPPRVDIIAPFEMAPPVVEFPGHRDLSA